MISGRGAFLFWAVTLLAYCRSTEGFPLKLTSVQAKFQGFENDSVLPVNGLLPIKDFSDDRLFCIVNETQIHCVKASEIDDAQYRQSFPKEFFEMEKDGSHKAKEGLFTLRIPEQLEKYSSPNQTLCKSNSTHVICFIVYAPGNNTAIKQIMRSIENNNGTKQIMRFKRASEIDDAQYRQSFEKEFFEMEKDGSHKANEVLFMLRIPEQLEKYSSANQTLCKSNNTHVICFIVYAPGNNIDIKQIMRSIENNTGNKQIMRFKRADNDYGEDENEPEIFFERDALSSCFVPKGLATAEVRCKVMPKSITCISFCVYGHTFDEGIERIHKCIYNENVWSARFEECTPFVDCSLKLISPGSLTCVGNTLQTSPSCDIGCEMYEENDALEQQTYFCKTDGTWEPPMPFCVEPKGTVSLARMPDVVEHSNIDYP